jgi:head-tail adaptor
VIPSSVQILGGRPVLDAGRLVRSITIEQQAQLDPLQYDAAGPKRSWTTFATAWASIESPTGRDANQGGQITTQMELLISMWYQLGILPSMRVRTDDGSIYQIQSIENVLNASLVLVLNCVGIGSNV